MKKYLYLLVLVFLVSGCASTTQFVPFPDQSKIVEDPNKARIYVVRPTSFGAAILMSVRDGDKFIGDTGPNGYLCWERDPGKAEVFGKAENRSRLALNVEKGMVYYIQQHVRMGWIMARNKLSQLTESEGKAKVKKCKPPKTD